MYTLIACDSPSFLQWEDSVNFTKSRAKSFITNLKHKPFISTFSTVASTNPFLIHIPCGIFRVHASLSIGCNILRDFVLITLKSMFPKLYGNMCFLLNS